MSRFVHGISSAVFCSGAIPVLKAETQIGLEETTLTLACLCSALGTRRRNRLFMTAHRALVEFVLSFLLLRTLVGLGMGGSWVILRQFPTPLGRSLVLGVSVSSFVEVVVVVVRVAVLVILRPKSLHFLVPRS